uniref:Uncharacterized protein n=1 Tax=Cacopsylla melanoneura TaxID=428564 RepID=A0A8D8M590_9HEMI
MVSVHWVPLWTVFGPPFFTHKPLLLKLTNTCLGRSVMLSFINHTLTLPARWTAPYPCTLPSLPIQTKWPSGNILRRIWWRMEPPCRWVLAVSRTLSYHS